MKYRQDDFNRELRLKIKNTELVLKAHIEKFLHENKAAIANKNATLFASFEKEGIDHFIPGCSSSVTIGVTDEAGEMIDLRVIKIWSCERSFLGVPTSLNIPGSKVKGEFLDETFEEVKEELKEYIDEMLLMDSVPKVKEILLDEEMEEQEFVSIINRFYKRKCYIYGIIPEFEEELLYEISNDFIKVNKFPLPYSFPREIGYLGYLKDSQKRYIYEFYLRSSTLNYLVFSEIDVSEDLRKLNKKNLDIYKLFELNKIPHITIGPDGQWLKIVDY